MHSRHITSAIPPKSKSIAISLRHYRTQEFWKHWQELLPLSLNKTLDEHLATRLASLNKKVNDLEAVNMDLKQEVTKQRQRIDELVTFTRSVNLVIRGLQELTAAERATGSMDRSTTSLAHSSHSVEQNVISFCKDTLNVPLSLHDISIAHRFKAGPKDQSWFVSTLKGYVIMFIAQANC